MGVHRVVEAVRCLVFLVLVVEGGFVVFEVSKELLVKIWVLEQH